MTANVESLKKKFLQKHAKRLSLKERNKLGLRPLASAINECDKFWDDFAGIALYLNFYHLGIFLCWLERIVSEFIRLTNFRRIVEDILCKIAPCKLSFD